MREKDVLHCTECGLTMTKEQAGKSFFIESPVSEQLQNLFASRLLVSIDVIDGQ